MANSPGITGDGYSFGAVEPAAETPEPRRNPPLAARMAVKAQIAVEQRAERVRTTINGSPNEIAEIRPEVLGLAG